MIYGRVTSCALCGIAGDGYTNGINNSYGLRPCFSLKTDIKITGGDGKTKETAYIMASL